MHADFVSGARQLAVSDGATVFASAIGDREFAHRGLADGDEMDLGGLRLRALTTPGHTGEHMAYLLLDGARPVGVFTGGSLLVGSAATFATLVPSSPGYAGTLDLALTKVLQDVVASVPDTQATAYALVAHYVVLILPVVVVGMLVLWRSHMTFSQITHEPDRLAPSPPRAGDERQAA